MRIAVIGAGISGLATAWLLQRQHRVTLFESNEYLGGHTHTHQVEIDGARLAVDTGFIVFNPQHYPLLTRLFAELGVRSQESDMSFSVRNEVSGLEYSATNFATLFCRRRNLISPRFYGMLRDIARFYREAPSLLDGEFPGPTLGAYLTENRYGRGFIEDHLVPMACALWSAPTAHVLEFPAAFLVRFMANHNMLSLAARPCWRVVCGGSASYVRALEERWRIDARRACPVSSVRRIVDGVAVTSSRGTERFDHVVMACHSDQTLRLLEDASGAERSILGAIAYQHNEVVLHTDPAFLPQRRRAWAAWNALVSQSGQSRATVSYCMNLLQGLQSPRPIIVTLNPTRPVDPARVLRRMTYEHPVFSVDAVRAQRRKSMIQGRRATWFAGAYWGYGFHEDGMRSALEVSQALGVDWPGTGASDQEDPARDRLAS